MRVFVDHLSEAQAMVIAVSREVTETSVDTWTPPSSWLRAQLLDVYCTW